MAATALVKDVLWRASVLLNDVSPQYQRWSERELVSWLNDAQTAIAKHLPAAHSRIDALKLRPGTLQSIENIAPADCKPGVGPAPTLPVRGLQVLDVVRNMGPDGATPGLSISRTERDILDTTTRDWHTIVRGRVDSYMFDPRVPRAFYVTPGVWAPEAGAVWVEVAYSAQPQAILNTAPAGSEAYRVEGTSTQTISVDDEFVEDLVNYVVARGNMKDTEWADRNKAAGFTALFVSSLNAKVAAVTGNNPNLQRLPFAPEPIGRAT